MSKRTRDEIIATIEGEFIAAMEKDQLAPWRKPWSADGTIPSNYFTKRPYRGINAFWLSLLGQVRGYESPYWTTANAAIKDRKQYPRKGEKASYAILWKPFEKEDRDTGEKKQFLMMREFAIFNSEQFDDLPFEVSKREPVDVPSALEDIRRSYRDAPALRHAAQDQAYYSPSKDEIVLPQLTQFRTVEGYAETYLHEHVHSTGHPSRLERFDLTANCRREYAAEELVAEIGAAMLMHHVGITPDMEGMASYVKGWHSFIKGEPGALTTAMGKAQKAFDLITGYEVPMEAAA